MLNTKPIERMKAGIKVWAMKVVSRIIDYQVNLNETNFVYALLVTVVGVSP